MADPFEDAGFDDAGAQRHDNLREIISHILGIVDSRIDEVEASRLAKADAVDVVLQNALVAVDMIFLERDASAVSSTSTNNASWVPEAAPPFCSMDAWLRAAIPEDQRISQSFAMDQFLRKSASIRSTSSMSRPTSTGGTRRQESSVGNSPSPRSPSKRMSGSPSSRARVMSPDAKSSEKRLREELEIRRAQAAIAKDLELKDAAEKQKLVELAKQLKGRDYTYDHKGQVVVLAQNDAGPSLGGGSSGYRLSTPETPEPLNGKASPKVNKDAPRRSMSKTASRKLTTDFREVKPHTQPNALDVLNPTQGVMIRQGNQSKSGPTKPNAAHLSASGLTRDEYNKLVAQKQQSAAGQSHSREAVKSARQQQQGPERSHADSKTSLPHSAKAPGSGPLSGLAELPLLSGGKPRERPEAKSSSSSRQGPDVNPMLTSARDWGEPGSQRAFDPPPSLPFIKPGDRQRELEVGRTVRLPRERVVTAEMLSKHTPPARFTGRVEG